MASGSFTKQVGNRTHISNEYIQVWWSSTPDPANNRSLVRVYAKMYRPWYLYVDYNQSIEMWINGTKFTGSRYGWRGSGWTEAYIDRSLWVPHNADGTKTVSIRVNTQVKAWLDSWVGWVDTGYRSCKLDNLARKSTFTLDKANAILDDIVNVNLARSSSTVRHAISLKVGDYTKSILAKADDNGSTKTYPIELSPDEFLPHMVGQSATATVTTTTYNGSASLGTNSQSFNLKLRSDEDKPSIPDGETGLKIEAIPIEPNTSTEHYVQGKTQARIIVSPDITIGDAGAIKTYKVSVNGVTGNYTSNVITTDALGISGVNTISATVIDGRGMESNMVTATIDVLPYFVPLISNLSIIRCLEDGTSDKSGTYIKVTLGYKFADSGGNNSATIVLSDRNSVDSNEYTEKHTWNIAATDEAEGEISEVLGVYSVDNSYDFKVSITDFFGAQSASFADIGTEELLVDLSSNGVGIGKVVERENALEVYWDAYFDGTVYGTVQANTSDVRKKLLADESISPLLAIWDELSVVLFRYRDGDEKILAGLIAQDVISIFNANELDWREYGIVYEDPATGFYSINYEFINQLSMLKVKMLQMQLNDLADRVARLEK